MIFFYCNYEDSPAVCAMWQGRSTQTRRISYAILTARHTLKKEYAYARILKGLPKDFVSAWTYAINRVLCLPEMSMAPINNWSPLQADGQLEISLRHSSRSRGNNEVIRGQVVTAELAAKLFSAGEKYTTRSFRYFLKARHYKYFRSQEKSLGRGYGLQVLRTFMQQTLWSAMCRDRIGVTAMRGYRGPLVLRDLLDTKTSDQTPEEYLASCAHGDRGVSIAYANWKQVLLGDGGGSVDTSAYGAGEKLSDEEIAALEYERAMERISAEVPVIYKQVRLALRKARIHG